MLGPDEGRGNEKPPDRPALLDEELCRESDKPPEIPTLPVGEGSVTEKAVVNLHWTVLQGKWFLEVVSSDAGKSKKDNTI